MALLVASLLLTALAPVMTRRMNENVVVQGNMSAAGTKQHVLEIEYGSEDCPEIKTDADGSTYCEGEFEVPSGYNGYFNVTAIGAGGGGGAAPTAGYTEYTTAGNHSFPVPVGIKNQIEATIVEGGAGALPVILSQIYRVCLDTFGHIKSQLCFNINCKFKY